MRIALAVLSMVAALTALPAHAQVASATVTGDTYSATISLPGGIRTELTVRFENAVGLDPSTLGVDAQLVDPLSPALLARLPDLTNLSVPLQFPLLISISPPSAGGFAFEGVAEVELYTRNLNYTGGTPLRLYSAAPGGAFRDITDAVAGGSYRPRGSTGHFSDFLIVADVRALTTVVDDKFAHLHALLQAHAASIDAGARDTLDGLAASAQAAWAGGDPASAADLLDDFESAAAHSAAGGQMPRVWRSARDLDNVDGELRAAARTLRFSLNQAANAL